MFNAKPRNILILACGIFLVFGMFNAAIGPVLSELANHTGSSLTAVGSVLTFLFLGALTTQLVTGPLTDRYGQKPLLLISLLLVAISLPAFTNARSLPLMLCLVFLTGMGQGGLDLGANLVVSSAYPKNNTTVLNLLHFFFGLGAIVGPAIVSLTLSTLGSGLIVHWFAAGVFFLLAIIVFRLKETRPSREDDARDHPVMKGKAAGVYSSALLWMICAMVLLFVGVEYGAGSWANRYMTATTAISQENAVLVTSAYFAAFTMGRLGGAALGSRISRIRLLLIAMLGCLFGTLILVLGIGVMNVSIIGFILIGLFIGTVYPTSVGLLVDIFPQDRGKAVGLLTAMGSIGGLSLPWLAGVMLENLSPRIYTLFLLAQAAIMLALLFLLSALLKKDSSS